LSYWNHRSTEANVVYDKVQVQQGAAKVQAGTRQMVAGASSAAQVAGRQAGRQAQQRAQQASASLGPWLRTGVFSARDWAASRLEDAADYTTSTVTPVVSDTLVNTVAPRVSSTLRSTARQVNPRDVPPARSRLRSVFTVAALVGAVLAGAGAIGAVVWRRYRAAMSADTEPDTVVYGTEDAAETPDSGTVPPGTLPAQGTPSSDEPVYRSSSSNW
jgi:hypothetical protein